MRMSRVGAARTGRQRGAPIRPARPRPALASRRGLGPLPRSHARGSRTACGKALAARRCPLGRRGPLGGVGWGAEARGRSESRPTA